VKFIAAINVIAECDAELVKIVLKYLLGKSWKCTLHKEETLIEFGITEAERETVFFVRHNGVGDDISGTKKTTDVLSTFLQPNVDGIDLDTIKKIIARHNGRVWTEEKAGLESTCFFTLQ
jgi:light-regulated signal transduction histidine kinase (bacteriophytochrome)